VATLNLDLIVPEEPETSTEEKVAHVFDLLRNYHGVLEELSVALLHETHVAPAKPREAMLRFADGTDWDPGSGRGLYQYVSGAWVKL
jgi:hypothetical protein